MILEYCVVKTLCVIRAVTLVTGGIEIVSNERGHRLEKVWSGKFGVWKREKEVKRKKDESKIKSMESMNRLTWRHYFRVQSNKYQEPMS